MAHVAAVLGGRVLLVLGGFSGVARGDLIAFKVPNAVLDDVPEGVSAAGGGPGGSQTHIWGFKGVYGGILGVLHPYLGAYGGVLGVPDPHMGVYGGFWGSQTHIWGPMGVYGGL